MQYIITSCSSMPEIRQYEIIYNFDLSLDAMRQVYLIKVNFSQMTQHINDIIDLSRC